MAGSQLSPAARPHAHIPLKYAIFFALAVLLYAVAYPWAITWVQTADTLLEYNGQTPPAPLRWALDSHITVHRVTVYGSDGSPTDAMLYQPLNRPDAPGMVIVHGLHPAGMLSVAAYARRMAATGLQVLTPDVPALRNYDLSKAGVSSLQHVGDSVDWMAQHTGRPVMLMGISFGGGLAMTVAGNQAYARQVQSVFDFGGYDDLNRLVRFYVTGAYTDPDGLARHAKRSPWVVYVLKYTELGMLGSPAQRAALDPLLRAEMQEVSHHPKGLDTKIAAMTAALTPADRQEWQNFLSNPDYTQYAVLIPSVAQTIAQISPHNHLEHLTADVYLLHASNDYVIPVDEAQWLVQDLPPGRLKAVLFSPLLSHVQLRGKNVTVWDKLRLVIFMERVQFAAVHPYANPFFWLTIACLGLLLAGALAIVAVASHAYCRQPLHTAADLPEQSTLNTV
jgi:dienelactone hydrolase